MPVPGLSRRVSGLSPALARPASLPVLSVRRLGSGDVFTFGPELGVVGLKRRRPTG